MNDLKDYMIEDVDGYDEFDDDSSVLESVIEELDSYDLDDDSVMESVFNMVMEGNPNNREDATRAGVLAAKISAKASKASADGDYEKARRLNRREDAIADKYRKRLSTPNGGDYNYYIKGKYQHNMSKDELRNANVRKATKDIVNKDKLGYYDPYKVTPKKKAKEDVDYDEFDRLVDEAIEEAEYDNTSDDIDALLESIENDYDSATTSEEPNTSNDIDDDLMFDDDDDFDEGCLDSATESALFIDFMLESCDSIEEFEELVNENATDWQLYGLIDDREMALEAIRIMKVENWKQKNRYRLIRRECIRIGKEKNDPNYVKYKKYRDLMRQFRQKLFDKYENLATRNVKAAHKNSVAKASNVKTTSSKTTLTRLGVDSHATSQANAQMNKAKSGTGISTSHTNSKKKLV